MIFVYFLLLTVSMFWIMKATNPFEESADYLGRNMPMGIKGATVNAIASSMPELVTTSIFLFIFNDESGFSGGVATTAGSAVFNALVIPSLVIFTVLFFMKGAVFQLSRKSIIRDGLFCIVAEILLIYILTQPVLKTSYALLLLLLYGLYILYMYVQYSKYAGENKEDNLFSFEENTKSRLLNFLSFDYRNMLHPNKSFTTTTALMSLLFSVVHISLACYLLAENIINIANYFGMNTFFVAIILAAAATSFPDTIISMRDAIKGNYDDSVSNAIGSNIFDICVGLGLPLLVYTLMYGSIDIGNEINLPELRVVLLGLTVLAIFLLLAFRKIGYTTAVILFAGYVFYASFSLAKGVEAEWAENFSVFIERYLSFVF